MLFFLISYKEEFAIHKETLRIEKNHILTYKNAKQQWKSRDFHEAAAHGLSKKYKPNCQMNGYERATFLLI